MTREQKIKGILDFLALIEEKNDDLMKVQSQRQKLLQVESETDMKRDISQNMVC